MTNVNLNAGTTGATYNGEVNAADIIQAGQSPINTTTTEANVVDEFTGLDLNNDGTISADEANAKAWRMGDSIYIDTDGDGLLDGDDSLFIVGADNKITGIGVDLDDYTSVNKNVADIDAADSPIAATHQEAVEVKSFTFGSGENAVKAWEVGGKVYIDTDGDGLLDTRDAFVTAGSDIGHKNISINGVSMKVSQFVEASINDIEITSTNLNNLSELIALRNNIADHAASARAGHPVDVPANINIDGSTVTISFGTDGTSISFTLPGDPPLNVAALVTQLKAAGLGDDLFDELHDSGNLNNPVFNSLIYQLAITETSPTNLAIMLRDINAAGNTTVLNDCVNFMAQNSRALLANCLIYTESPINAIIDQLESNGLLDDVLLGVSDNNIAAFFHYDRVSNDNKLALINCIMDDSNSINPANVLDNMSISTSMRMAFEEIISELDPNANPSVKAFLEQMVTYAVSRNNYSDGAEMLNSLASTCGEDSLDYVIKNLISRGDYADIGGLICNWRLSGSNTNAVVDCLEDQGKLDEVIAVMTTNQWFTLLDRDVLTESNYSKCLDEIVATNQSNKIGDLLLKALNNNIASPMADSDGCREDLIAKLSLTQLENVMKTYSSDEAALLIGIISGDTLIKIALSMVLSSDNQTPFKFSDGKSAFSVLDNLNTIDMERVVSTLGAEGTLLNQFISGSTQADVNNWLSDLVVTWSQDHTPSLGGLSDLSNADASWISSQTASLLIGASVHGADIVKSAYVQEVMSDLAGGAFDFSDGIQGHEKTLLVGLLVNDPASFLKVFEALVSHELMGDSALDGNDLWAQLSGAGLSVTMGGMPLTLTNNGWQSASGDVFNNTDLTINPTNISNGTNAVSITFNGITISTQMTLSEKIAVINDLLEQYKLGHVTAEEIADLFIGIASFGGGDMADGTTLLMDQILNSTVSNLTSDQKNSILFSLAGNNQGVALLNTYVLTDQSLHAEMFDGFVDYCLTKIGAGPEVLANLLNSNYDLISSGTFTNRTLNQILSDLTASDQFSQVMSFIDPETVAAILNNDDVAVASKVAIRTEINANWSAAKIADIFKTNGTGEGNGIDIGLTESAAEALINSLSQEQLMAVLGQMTPEQILQMINTGNGIDDPALTKVFVALNESNNTAAMTLLLSPSNMTHHLQEKLLTVTSDANLLLVLNNLKGAGSAALVNSSEGFDARIMDIIAASTGFSVEEKGIMLNNISVSGKSYLVTALATAGQLDDVIASLGVDGTKNILSEFGLSNAAESAIISNLYTGLGAEDVKDLMTSVPSIQQDQLEAIVATLSEPELSAVLSKMTSGDAVNMLININDGDTKVKLIGQLNTADPTGSLLAGVLTGLPSADLKAEVLGNISAAELQVAINSGDIDANQLNILVVDMMGLGNKALATNVLMATVNANPRIDGSGVVIGNTLVNLDLAQIDDILTALKASANFVPFATEILNDSAFSIPAHISSLLTGMSGTQIGAVLTGMTNPSRISAVVNFVATQSANLISETYVNASANGFAIEALNNAIVSKSPNVVADIYGNLAGRGADMNSLESAIIRDDTLVIALLGHTQTSTRMGEILDNRLNSANSMDVENIKNLILNNYTNVNIQSYISGGGTDRVTGLMNNVIAPNMSQDSAKSLLNTMLGLAMSTTNNAWASALDNAILGRIGMDADLDTFLVANATSPNVLSFLLSNLGDEGFKGFLAEQVASQMTTGGNLLKLINLFVDDGKLSLPSGSYDLRDGIKTSDWQAGLLDVLGKSFSISLQNSGLTITPGQYSQDEYENIRETINHGKPNPTQSEDDARTNLLRFLDWKNSASDKEISAFKLSFQQLLKNAIVQYS